MVGGGETEEEEGERVRETRQAGPRWTMALSLGFGGSAQLTRRAAAACTPDPSSVCPYLASV